MSKDIFYTDFDYGAILAQEDDGIDPLAAAKQDLSENQDPYHLSPDIVSGANCVPDQLVPPTQRGRLGVKAVARVRRDLAPSSVGTADSADSHALVTRIDHVDGVIAFDPLKGTFSIYDAGTRRWSRGNAGHVPKIPNISGFDSTLTTKAFPDAGNNGRRPIAGRPEVSFQDREDNKFSDNYLEQ